MHLLFNMTKLQNSFMLKTAAVGHSLWSLEVGMVEKKSQEEYQLVRIDIYSTKCNHVFTVVIGLYSINTQLNLAEKCKS